MKTAAIIAEYNPFHNGHAYHLQKTRDAGCTHIIAVMSGNFVQRGSPAIADKFLRAKAAVCCGVDLVLELPLPWSVSAAQDFADGGVQIAKAAGVVDVLSFGCESDDLCVTEKAIEVLQDNELQALIKKNLQYGLSYPNAVSKALQQAEEAETFAFISSPNNMLAFEYCRSLQNTTIKPLPIKRFGSVHDGESAVDGFSSASLIRNEIYSLYNAKKELYDLYNEIPSQAAECFKQAFLDGRFPLDLRRFDIAALSRLRMLSSDDLLKLPYVSDGMENRLFDAIQSAISFECACDAAKNKQVTHARVRRSFLQATLGLQVDDRKDVPYLRVLAMNEKGKELLKIMRNKATLPIVMKHADSKSLDSYAKRVYDFNLKAGDFYSLCLPKPYRCGMGAFTQIYIE